MLLVVIITYCSQNGEVARRGSTQHSNRITSNLAAMTWSYDITEAVRATNLTMLPRPLCPLNRPNPIQTKTDRLR